MCVCVRVCVCAGSTTSFLPNIPYMDGSGTRGVCVCVCVCVCVQIVPQAFCFIPNIPYTAFRTTQRLLTCSFVGFMPTMTVAHFNR